ncbi:MAG: pre-peptidase C-terminal domain-containing protein [Planctomycetia bacterium]|nr:pre-peptidase C-terminal domain-containing protein [Planctomycetia bacterium]
MRLTPLALAALLLAAPQVPVHAKPPTLTALEPSGARQGTTTLVTAVGTFDRWPVRGWVSGDGVSVEPATAKGTLWVTVAEGAPAGPRWLRVHDDDGASALRPFFVGTVPEVNEVEPNDDPKRPQALDGDAVTVHGVLARNGDVDGFALSLRRGQTLVASMEANRRLGSPMDGVLQVVGDGGFVLAQNDDERDRDPQLVFQATRDGVHVVRTFAFPATPDSRIGFSGGPTFGYRLTLTTRGFLDHVSPLAVRRDTTTTVRAEGWNIPEAARKIDVRPDGGDVVPVSSPRLAGWAEVRQVTHGVAVESEPNPADAPQDVTPPVCLTGRIDPDGDADVFRFCARKGTKLSIRVESRSLGFPLDPTLRLTDAGGKVLSEVDDTGGRRGGGRDAEMAFPVPGDGDYRLTVRDLNGHGGPRSVYRLTVGELEPGVRLALPSDRFTVTPGAPLALKVEVDRVNGFAGTVEVRAVGLPEGVTSAQASSEAGGKSVTLTVIAREGRRSGPFRVVGSYGTGRGTAEAPIDGFPETTPDAWLTVSPGK